MAETLGIENIKRVVAAATSLANKADTQFADGLQAMDFFAFIGDFAQLPALLKDKDLIKAEIADLSAAEREELSTYFKDQLNLKNDHIESIIEGAVDFILAGINFYEIIKG